MPTVAQAATSGNTVAEPFRATVVVPTYNSARFLPDAIESVLDQTLAPCEVIVVDDGSQDNTPAVLARYSRWITAIRQENRGVSASRNLGLDLAHGDWVAFLDADDIWLPAKLERVAAACQSQPRPTCVFTAFEVFGSETGTRQPTCATPGFDSDELLLAPTSSVMPSAAVVRAGLPMRFPTWARNDEDAIYFNELAETGRMVALPEVLMRYRKHPNSAQARAGDAQGFANLLRWAESKNDGGVTRRRLLKTYAHLMVRAKWQRNWNRYWTFRRLVLEHWHDSEPVPAAVRERVWPKCVYRAKDAMDGAVGRWKKRVAG